VGVTQRDAKVIREAIHSAREADYVLELADSAIPGACGIEALRDDRAFVDRFYYDTIAIYVNLGDTYAPTLLFDTARGAFSICSWGGFYESWKARQRQED